MRRRRGVAPRRRPLCRRGSGNPGRPCDPRAGHPPPRPVVVGCPRPPRRRRVARRIPAPERRTGHDDCGGRPLGPRSRHHSSDPLERYTTHAFPTCPDSTWRHQPRIRPLRGHAGDYQKAWIDGTIESWAGRISSVPTCEADLDRRLWSGQTRAVYPWLEESHAWAGNNWPRTSRKTTGSTSPRLTRPYASSSALFSPDAVRGATGCRPISTTP